MQDYDTTQKIDSYIARQEEWKQEKLQAFRDLVHEVQPQVTEEWKWNVPIFTVGGRMRLSMAAFKGHVKYNFFVKGVEFNDTGNLFNNGFDSVNFRSIDLKDNESVDRQRLHDLLSQFLA